MDNAAKALEIAAGVMLGVLLFAAVAYFFSSIGSGPEDEEKSMSAEQLAKFNLEYEIYNKKRMYGVDVISCLNKAISNNEKYVAGEGFLTGQAYGEKYKIDVAVTITKPLEEHLHVYRIKDGKSIEILQQEDISDLMLSGAPIPSMGDLHFKFPESGSGTKKITNLVESKNILENLQYNRSYTNGLANYLIVDLLQVDVTYELLGNNGNMLTSLLSFSNDNMRQIKYNTTGLDLDVWNSVEWETALYYFKKKKFKCLGVEYNESTGRVNRIEFIED